MARALFAGLLACGCWLGWAAWLPAVKEDVMVQTYQKAVEIDPNDVVDRYNLGLCLFKLERYDEAQAALTQCLETNRQDQRSHRQVDGSANQLLGTLAFNVRHDDRRALEYFQRSLKDLPRDPETYYALGMAHHRLQEYGQAAQAFKQAIEYGRGQDPDSWYQLGLAQAAGGQDQDAIASFEASLKLKPEQAAVLENLAMLYHRRGESARTFAVAQRLLKLEPANLNANYLLGLYYYRQQRFPEMVAAYKQVVAVKPDLADAHYNLGMAYFYQTRYEQAIEELKQAVQLNPKDAEAYNLLGQAQTAAIESHLHQGGTLLAQENYPEAVAELQKVFLIDPNHARARELLDDAERRIREGYAEHMRLAQAAEAKKRLADAYGEYEQAARLQPDSPEAQSGLRRTSLELGDRLRQGMRRAREAEQLHNYKQALAQYDALLQLSPGYEPARAARLALHRQLTAESDRLFVRAEQQTRRGELTAAAGNFKRALRLAESLDNGELQERARTGLSKVNDRSRELVRQYLAQAKQAMADGQDAKAKDLCNRALQLDPQNETANDYIVKLTGAQAQAKVTDEEIKATYYRGVDFYVNGKIKEAIQEWEKVVALDPENEDAQNNIRRAKAKMKSIRELTQGY